MKKSYFFSLLFFSTLFGWSQTKVYFQYDKSGNQIQYYYNCDNPAHCPKESVTKPSAAVQEHSFKLQVENQFSVYPNPTKGWVVLRWTAKVSDLLSHIQVVGINTNYAKQVPFNQAQRIAFLHLSRAPSGYYGVRFYLKDNTMITKKILKQ